MLIRLLPPVKKAHDRPSNSGVSSSLKLSYRVVQSERFAQNLRNVIGNINIYLTTDKLRSQLGGLKAAASRDIRSHLVYEITCLSCGGTYVSQTTRPRGTRIREHRCSGIPIGDHFITCNGGTRVTMDNVKILGLESHPPTLLALQAVFIQRLKPSFNTRHEHRSHTLNYAFSHFLLTPRWQSF